MRLIIATSLLTAFICLESKPVFAGPDKTGKTDSAVAPHAEPGHRADGPHSKSGPRLVQVYVFNRQGKFVGPVDSPRLNLTPVQWRHRLTADQYNVLRAKDTEDPFCGVLLDNKKEGIYACAGCGLPLFSSAAKFESGSGWPSFMQPMATANIGTRVDNSRDEQRLEVHCVRCSGHLGHVFGDGPPPLGLRYCLNSAAFTFTAKKDLAQLADPAADELPGSDKGQSLADESKSGRQLERAAIQTAVFAGGCFWCTEFAFEGLKGVIDVQSGYCGGTQATAYYELVHEGTTRHAESIRITYDPQKISYEKLLDVFFDAHNPTQLNRQGDVDFGRQYRSAIFYVDDQQKKLAEEKIKSLRDKKTYRRRIVTKVEPLVQFYPAEDYHQNFARRFPFDDYIQRHAFPKAYDVRLKHPDLVTPPNQ